MRRTIYALLFCLCSIAGMAQTAELMRIYTDKDCYLAGEELWVKISLDDEALPGNVMSRVAYVEICDTAQVRAQGKVALTQGVGWACIQLPPTMHSGVYQLTAYTRYMRNLKPDCFPRKHVAVLNTLGASTEDRLKVNDTTMFPKSRQESAVLDSQWLKGDKEVYGRRDKVSLSWPSQWAEAKDLTLSVVRKDCEVQLSPLQVSSPERAGGPNWVAECEGHIVSGQVEGSGFPLDLSAQLSCVGKSVNVFDGVHREDGLFNFYTFDVTGQQDIVLSSRSNNEGKTFRMEIVSPFAELLPKQLPALSCMYEDSALIARSVALQLAQAMPKAALPKELESVVYNQLPVRTYNLDEYVRFNTVRECVIEFLMGVAFDKEDGREVIRLLQEDRRTYNVFPVLVLIDGVAFHDHSDVLNYNARQIHYAYQYRGIYTLGGQLYGGILSFITHRGTMPDMRIGGDMQMLAYEFPQDRPDFRMPDYENEEVKTSRRPDFRHTLYWNPAVEGKTGASFYTSDLNGVYVATLTGLDAEGKKIEERWEFEVR